MKTKKLPVILLAILMVFSVLPIGAFAASRSVAADSTASITIENALENDVLAAYKVIDITYDPSTNTLSYAWNSNFTDYFAGRSTYNKTAYTVEQFAAITSESDTLKDLLAQLPNYIANEGIAAVDTQSVAADGTAKFENLAMGEYFIRPTSSTSVYQLMLRKIEPIKPSETTGNYTIDDVSFTAKHKEVSVDKTADKTSVTKGEKVKYTIEADIPTYASDTADRTFSITDKMADGLSIDDGSLTLTVNGTSVDNTDNAAYTLDKNAGDNYTFKISVDNTQYDASWRANAAKKLVITYTATLNNDTTTEVNVAETNTATFDYSFYPYVEGSHNQQTDTVEVKTFEIQIVKHKSGEPSTKLAGATFALYRTLLVGETGGEEIPLAKDLLGNPIQGKLLETLTTDDNGVASFKKYEANGTKYDYYLVETKAPTGYNILSSAKEITFSDTGVAATSGVYTVQVANSSGIELPITGGMGTVIFTALGIVLMGTALTAYIIFRKKVKAKESR